MHEFPSLNRLACALVASLSVAAAGCGTDSAPGEYNNCSAAMFVDRSAAGASRTVGYGGALGSGLFAYSPSCITIAAGQTVTFSGGTTTNFGVHPLAPGVLNALTAGSPNNPIPRLSDGSRAETTVTFPTAGTYPFVCEAHASAGMVGVVHVQ